MAQVIGIIPARYGSTRFPGKPLADLLGKPMIQHVYERSSKARCLERLLVATDDQRILDAVAAFGGEAVMTSPDHPTGTDRLAEAAAELAVEIVVNIQGDEPLIEPSVIDALAAPLIEDSSIPMGTLMSRITEPADLHDPNVVKVVVDRNSFALYFSRTLIPYAREVKTEDVMYYYHPGLYVYRKDFLLTYASLPPTPLEKTEKLEQLRAMEHGYRIKVVETAHRPVSVDTPHDLEHVKHLMQRGR
ncbi:MAG: 3-deoxy-manno-octulosonate cytidylyltransferase [Armatimonadota bacterium]|nr:MAG: 3-deoxy-manno-octulosonate cytidylyltransferase [Armatimonadota bacterium]